MRQTKWVELKLILIGWILGVIATLLLLKALSIPYIVNQEDFIEEDEEFLMDYEVISPMESSESADLEQF